MASYGAGRLRAEMNLHVDGEARPGWRSAVDVPVSEGDTVYCAEGQATVVKVLGKTGDGSNLLELKLPTANAKPFFAAASNVLVEPRES